FKLVPGSSFSASAGTSADNQVINVARHPITSDVDEAFRIIAANYGGDKPATASMVNSAIEGMLLALDPHSSYFNAAEFRQMLDEQNSGYFGIGTTIADYEFGADVGTFVVSVNPDSPAESAGLKYGDRIIGVASESMAGKTSEYVRDVIRGKSGTTVSIKVERANGETAELNARRTRVEQPTVGDAYVLRDGIGYIDLTDGFNYTTDGEIERALKSLRRSGSKSLILDLRGNSGGILEQAVKVAGRFLPAGEIVVSQRGRSGFDNRVWRSSNDDPEKMPIVVLVNEDSASASEVVVGAFQDHCRAVIVGEKTFGKGLVQSVIDLPSGGGLALTTARYYTPSGRSLQRDYAAGLYAYFNHKATAAARQLGETSQKQAMRNGDGITPDYFFPAEKLSTEQILLLDPMFFFVRKMTAAANEKHNPAVSADRKMQSLIPDSFAGFVQQSGNESIAAVARAAKQFVAQRLNRELTLASAGQKAAGRATIKSDPLVAFAISVMPRAAQLADAAFHPRRHAKKR
ncbi:MAG: S41 family peptidase, partial [Pyrinomonadaceae bacterium]